MAFSDKIDPKDNVLFHLMTGPSSDQLPAMMQCPQGHHAYRELYKLTSKTSNYNEFIPFYVCTDCTVIYRYQELILVPGDEGAP